MLHIQLAIKYLLPPQGVIWCENSWEMGSQLLLSAVNFHVSWHEIVICHENNEKLLINNICYESASKQSTVIATDI